MKKEIKREAVDEILEEMRWWLVDLITKLDKIQERITKRKDKS